MRVLMLGTETVNSPYNQIDMGLRGIRALTPSGLGGAMDFKDISPELREKAKACKTPEELLALAKQEGYNLSDEDMEVVSGGVDWSFYPGVFHCTEEYQT